MVISNAHKGLVKAIRKIRKCNIAKLAGTFLKKYPIKSTKENTEEFRTYIKTQFKIQDINLARKMKDEIFLKYENEKKFQNSLNTLDEGFKDAFAHLAMM